MKTTRAFTLLCMAGFILASIAVKAQADSFDADIMKLQQVNGSVAATNSIFPRIVAQFKQSKPEVTEAQWIALKTDVFDAEVAKLNEELVPTFKKYFTQAEVKAMIAFYETPTGKKMAETTPQISMDQMQLTQTWAMGLMGKIKGYLDKQPVDNTPPGLKSTE